MSLAQKIARRFTFYVVLASVWLLAVNSAVAQPPPAKAPEAGGMDYTMPYAVVILGLVLGLMIVSRASNRRDRERPAGYVEKDHLTEKN